MDADMQRSLGNIEGRIHALEERQSRTEKESARSFERLENKMEQFVEKIVTRLDQKLEALADKQAALDRAEAWSDGNRRGARWAAAFVVGLLLTAGGLLLEVLKLGWNALHGP